MSQLTLGTAQFGDSYGITNASGRLSDETVRDILADARRAGVRTLDTSPAYGDAQRRLRELRDPLAPIPGYISKITLDPDPDRMPEVGEIAAIAGDLGVSSLEGILLHRIPDLRDPRASGLVEVLMHARADGLVARIGASVYDLEDLELALDRFPALDLVQIPGSIVDRRLLDHPLVAQLKRDNVRILVRSAFLQGLLLLDPAALPPGFDPLAEVVAELQTRADALATTRLGLALRFLRDHPVCDDVLVGATSVAEFAQIADQWQDPRSLDLDFAHRLPPEVLDPRSWNR